MICLPLIQVESPLVEWGPDKFLWVVRIGSSEGEVFCMAKVFYFLRFYFIFCDRIFVGNIAKVFHWRKRACAGKRHGFFKINPPPSFSASARMDKDRKRRLQIVFSSLDPVQARCLHDGHAEVHAWWRGPPAQHPECDVSKLLGFETVPFLNSFGFSIETNFYQKRIGFVIEKIWYW